MEIRMYKYPCCPQLSQMFRTKELEVRVWDLESRGTHGPVIEKNCRNVSWRLAIGESFRLNTHLSGIGITRDTDCQLQVFTTWQVTLASCQSELSFPKYLES